MQILLFSFGIRRRPMAKLLFIGPRKGRVILIPRLCRRLRRGAALLSPTAAGPAAAVSLSGIHARNTPSPAGTGASCGTC